MIEIKKVYYDQDPSKRWVFNFDVLFIRPDHRRILNREPILYRHGSLYFMFIDVRTMAN